MYEVKVKTRNLDLSPKETRKIVTEPKASSEPFVDVDIL